MNTVSNVPPGGKIWVEMMVEVSSDLCDIVSEFLASRLGRGVLIEDIPDSGPESREKEKIRAYLNQKELDSGLLQEIQRYLMELPGVESGAEIRISTRPIVEEDWSQGWKAYFKPLRVGKRIVIKPSWEAYVPDPMDIVVEVDPGMAFGTGTHPSTAMVIKAMEHIWENRGWSNTGEGSGPEVLDVGTGTGILGIAAAKLGASSVLCLDVDPDAVETARENAYKNHVHHRVSVTLTPIWQIGEEFDLILANLDKATLLLLAKDLVKRLASGGMLVISGILEEQENAVKNAFGNLGLHVVQAMREDEWVCLTLMGG